MAWCCCVESDESGAVALISLPPAFNKEGDSTSEEAPSSFTARLDRAVEGQSFGMRLEAFDGSTIHVALISSDVRSVVGRYNASSKEGVRIRSGDYIEEVNGRTNASEMRDLLESCNGLEVRLRRPKLSEVNIKKGDLPLGLGIKYDQDGTSLAVRSIDEGGAVACAGVDIRRGDRIVAVNGRACRTNELLDELRRSDALRLTISR
eukprot:CAMPEP_0176063454 /NCGR_PEP_ID=MMETSP0120_2-20121206/31647_1 /TAXON_ID=160619 /ORGANISM="Kryptoperidinium foliaceum, Strain CCMP 1326" /LENGTH=205 /DNA_ID=CAMNT_0017397027 /DNA_START=8 /DNA_END=625 /DNA_ORIENTATION=+